MTFERIARPVDDRRAGVVARRLDRQDQALTARRLEPHDQGVLAVVVVVAAAVPGGPEAEALVHLDRGGVRGPHLEREAGVAAGPLEQPLDQLGRDRRARRCSGATAMFIRCQTSA